MRTFEINWRALSTIAELIGAAGVVVSLIYVAAEIRQNTRQVEETNRIQRVAQLEAAYENFSRLRQLSAQSAEVTQIWLLGLEDPEALNAVDRARFEAMLGEFLNASQVLYARVEEGGLYPEVWDDLVMYLETLLQQPGAREHWRTSREGYRSGFVAAVERSLGGPAG
ncbi:MAG: hypothetical protein R3266_06305 [Gemmatimonadota bacterium]|nr:hypothetical protein [Gemmatimonadota bacterium]